MTNRSLDAMVGDTVAHDSRSAGVFARRGIDFCCGGRRSIEEACRASHVDPGEVLAELQVLEARPEAGTDLTMAPVEVLIDRIVTQHHAYVRVQMPIIQGYLTKLTTKHGSARPELTALADVFARMGSALTRHMDKEERILFPSIRTTSANVRRQMPPEPSPFGTVRNPIRMMEEEHRNAAADLDAVRRLTHDYQPPPDACMTWRACYAALQAFEEDLHAHVHLENNVLFPAAARLEDRAATTS